MLTIESRGMVGTNTALIVFAALSVVLRFHVRRPKAFSLELDDYMVLAALVSMSDSCQPVPCSSSCAKFFSIALAVTNITGVFAAGFGTPFESLSGAKGVAFLKVGNVTFDVKLQLIIQQQVLFVLQFWYILAVAFVKLSILCFYGRLFSARRFPIVVKIMILVTGAGLVSFLFATFFQFGRCGATGSSAHLRRTT